MRITPLLILLLTVATISIVVGQATAVCALAPTAVVASVAHPSTVPPGLPFGVTVTVDYSDKFLADVGIWDPEAGTMLRSATLISSFTGPGKTDFTFQLTAPKSQTKWHLIAMTRVWWEDAWYQDPKGGIMLFDVSIISQNTSVNLTLTSTVPATTMWVDGVSDAIGNLRPLSLTIRPGTHTLEAKELVLAKEGERFVFNGWSDGVNSNPRSLTITADADVTALYGKEYYLNVTANGSQPTGEGWYPEGTVATFSLLQTTYQLTTWSGFMTYDYRFAGWMGDSDSTADSASVLMDGPKSVSARWVQSGTQIDLMTVGSLILLAASPLAIRVAFVYRKRQAPKSQTSTTRVRPSTFKCFAVLCFIAISFTFAAPVHAQLPVQPHTTVVKIGNAYWYYWNQAHSDTCVLWLGGGISQETFSGYNYYWVNPFDYESFGTIHFIQDLANYYCILALQKGSYAEVTGAPNRTIYQELYQIQSTIIANVHSWIKQHGYEHTVLMGYSVGGQAAAMEVAIRDPGNWTNADALVLITVPLENSAINHAHSIRTNLLFLYGGNLPDFVTTGQQFYNNAPPEGRQGSTYYHKEFHVLQEVGHEVWTVRDSGEYSTTARNIVITFIEKSKALKFPPELGSIEPHAETWSFNLTSVQVPPRTASGDVISINVDVSQSSPSVGPLALLAYDAVHAELVSAQNVTLDSHGKAEINLVVSPQNTTILPLSVILVQQVGGTWSIVAQPRSVSVVISDLRTLKLTANVPNLTLFVDGTQYTTDQAGHFEMETLRGVHTIQAPPLVYEGNVTRVVFTQWSDSNDSPLRQVSLENDTTLSASYRKQYYVAVISPYGTPLGSGWYDENSTAIILVQPPVIRQEGVSFTRWTGDAIGTQPSASIFVDSPKTAQAEWTHYGSEPSQSNLPFVVWVIFSGVVFAVLLVVNLKRRS